MSILYDSANNQVVFSGDAYVKRTATGEMQLGNATTGPVWSDHGLLTAITAPATPAAGKGRLYAAGESGSEELYWLNSGGSAKSLSAPTPPSGDTKVIYNDGGAYAAANVYYTKANGYFGIGQASPGERLHLKDGSGNGAIVLGAHQNGTAIAGTVEWTGSAMRWYDGATWKNVGIDVTDPMTYKGAIDCSANPNYPAADAGDTYRISVAGKIGGASGVNVEAGDMAICTADSTASGDQATVGTYWDILQMNLDGAVLGPASATADGIAIYNSTTGKLVKNSLSTIDSAGSLNIPSGQTYKINGSALTYSNVGAAASSHAHGNITSAGAIGSTANLPIITTTSGVLTVGSFGTGANTFCVGNDSRLSDSRTPTAHNLIDTTGHPVSGLTTGHFLKSTGATTYAFGAHGLTYSDVGAAATSHAHGNITSAGAIGSTATLPIITTTSGVLTAGSFGSSAGTFCVGNDSRLSDARTPTSHNLFSSSHGDTVADTVARGDILYGNATPKWAVLSFPASPTGKVLQATATDVAWSASALGTAAFTATGDYATAAQGILATNALPKGGGTMTGAIVMQGATSGTCTVQVASVAGTSTIFQLPINNGTNGQVLQTNGGGVTSWATTTPSPFVIPSSDHSYSGVTMSATAGETLAIGDVCYLKSDGKFWLADADAQATADGMLAMATAAISTDATGVFLLQGLYRDDTWAWTVGGKLYISATPGNPTQTAPSTTGQVQRIVGYGLTADVAYFGPDTTFVELS